MQIDYPYHIDRTGVTATAGTNKHVLDLMEQVLFTNPGERVNRPTFGSGLLQLIFAPGGTELAAATQFLVQGALQQTLADVAVIHTVSVETIESTLLIKVQYSIKGAGTQEVAVFERSM